MKTATLHDGTQLHFPDNTSPEAMDAGVQHHLAGRKMAAGEPGANQYAAGLVAQMTALRADVEQQSALLQGILQALGAMGARTAGAINASTNAIVAAVSTPKSIVRDPVGKIVGVAHGAPPAPPTVPNTTPPLNFSTES